MAGNPDDTTRLQVWLDRMEAGDPAAAEGLIGHALDRLRRLTRKMLRGYPAVHRWEQTDDVLHNAVIRLQRSLTQMRVGSVRGFFNLAAEHIRRELIDLARHYYGPQGFGANHASGRASPSEGGVPLHDRPDETGDPARLAEWGEFHRLVEALPAEEREVFNLLWYHSLSQAEAAALLNVTERTVRRRWRAARLRLDQALHGGQTPPNADGE
jgi:RNA polymerase sigma-70 factor (ECF subfamily)